ncbi:MAG: DUF5320 family protein [Candidatus Omnitrophota bacterium]
MPRGDGTGPQGQGPGTGRGLGAGQGRFVRKGIQGRGPGGFCVCANCGMKIGHQSGLPCTHMNCPKCNIPMSRG